MYVIDVTRDFNDTDILCGNDSMDAKAKTINYIMEYTLANCNISLDRNILDQNLDISHFSLKQFLNEYYSTGIDRDLLIQSIPVDKNHCLFLKYMDDKTDFPVFYSFHKKEMKYAQGVMRFLVNDTLIDKYKDNLSEYERLKMREDTTVLDTFYPHENIKCRIVSLYKGGLFLEELLNNSGSLNQLKEENYTRGFDV